MNAVFFVSYIKYLPSNMCFTVTGLLIIVNKVAQLAGMSVVLSEQN